MGYETLNTQGPSDFPSIRLLALFLLFLNNCNLIDIQSLNFFIF